MSRNMVPKYLMCCLLLFLTTAAAAQEAKTWNGTASHNWSDADNWTPAGAPAAHDNVTIQSSTGSNQPLLDLDQTVGNLSIEPGASLTINGYKLTVNGDLTIGTSGIVLNHLIMTHSADQLIVNGNATFAARTKLDSGRVFLRGNLVQESVNLAVQPGATEFILDGTIPQSVSFQRPGTNNQSFFKNLSVRNPAGVSFLTDVHVTGLLRLENGGKLVQDGSLGTFFYQQLPLTSDGSYLVRKSYVASQMVMADDRALSDPQNDVIVLARNSLTLGGHTLHVSGTLTVRAYGDQKHLLMTDAADVLMIDGDAIFEGHSTLTAGTIFVRGNLVQRVSSAALQPDGTVFVLDGAQSQTVTIERPGTGIRSFLRDLVVKNPAGVNFASDIYITGKLEVNSSSVSQDAMLGTYFSSTLPVIDNSNYSIVNSYVAGDIALDNDLTLPNADNHLVVLPRNALALNGHKLEVGGNFTVRVFEESKHLIMTQSTDTLVVNGVAEFQGQSDLTAGAIIVKGDLLQKISGKSLQPSGTHFFLAGTAPQFVSFEKPGTGNRSFLNDLTLQNPSGITFASDVYIAGQLRLEQGSTLAQAEEFGTNYLSALPKIVSGTYAIHNSNVAGAIVMAEDVRLSQPVSSLTILPKQSLTLNGHMLEVGGDFKAGVFNAEKHLIMSNATDRLLVNGNATFEGLNVLQAGEIVLHGNLAQAISAAAIQPEGTKFVFDGKKAQIVSFERPGTGNRSYLQNVRINNAASVRVITDMFVTGQINNYGKLEVIDTRTLFLGESAGINHNGGMLVGNGTVNTPATSFTNEGNVRPGASPGIMRIAGSYLQQPDGKLTIEIGGLEVGSQYSRLVVSSTAELAGTLELDLTSSYQVSLGDSFRVINYGSTTGKFAEVISNLPKNVEFQVKYKANGVDLVATEAANRAPEAQDDSATTRMNVPVTIKAVQNDHDANGDPLKISALDLTNTVGEAVIAGDSSIAYMPKKDYYGTDSFGYTVIDSRGGKSTARVVVEIQRANRPPVVAKAIPDVTVIENSAANILFDRLSTVFDDPDGDALSLSAKATADLAVWIAGDSLFGTPQQSFVGEVEVHVTAKDDSNAIIMTSFKVTVAGTNKPPAAFSLLQPQDGAIVNPTIPVIFRWNAAQDANHDSLVYSVRLVSHASDSTISGITTNELRFDGNGYLLANTGYVWTVSVSDGEFTTASADTFSFTAAVVTSVDNPRGQTPEAFALEQNYPNPFNPSTTIRYNLPKSAHVMLKVYSALGHEVRTLIDGEETAGYKSITWDGRDNVGRPVATGMYLYKITAGEYSRVRQMIFTK